MSPTLTLLLVMSLGGTAETGAERETQAMMTAAVLNMADVTIEQAHTPALIEVARDVSFYYGEIEDSYGAPVDAPILVSYDLSLPIFRDFL